MHFDQAPVEGDLSRWTALFDEHVRALQPASRHTTFAWNGAVRGCVEPFIDSGYALQESVVLATDKGTTIQWPHENRAAHIASLSASDWAALRNLLIETRDGGHSLEGYTGYVERRIAAWRALCEACGWQRGLELGRY